MKNLFNFGENLGEVAQKSLKIQSCFQISRAWFLGYFAQSLPKFEQFFSCSVKLSNFWERTSPKTKIGIFSYVQSWLYTSGYVGKAIQSVYVLFCHFDASWGY